MADIHWYALRVRAQNELITSDLLRTKGYEVLAPSCTIRKKWSDRIKKAEVPLFPGYVFCRFDPEIRSCDRVITTPGVLTILGFGGRPTPIDDVEIESVRLATQQGMMPKPYLRPVTGSKVRLVSGPLAGAEGFVLKTRTQHTLVVSVSLLNRSIAVDVDCRWIDQFDGTFPQNEIGKLAGA